MITIDNYEEYFLDYCEGNLDEAKRREVHCFLNAHPEYRAELEDFLGSPVLDEDTDIAVPANLADSLRHFSKSFSLQSPIATGFFGRKSAISRCVPLRNDAMVGLVVPISLQI